MADPHDISKLAELYHQVVSLREYDDSPHEARDLVNSVKAIINALGTDNVPPKAQDLLTALVQHVDQLETENPIEDRDSPLAEAAAASSVSLSAAEIENVVDQRLNHDSSWPPGLPQNPREDIRDIPIQLSYWIEQRKHDSWPSWKDVTDEVQNAYRAPWRADRNHGQMSSSPFAEIFKQPISLPDGDSGSAKTWENKGRPFPFEKGDDGLVHGGAGYVERWRMKRQNGESLDILVKTTDRNPFFGDYCSEGNYTLRLNALGCKNVIKVLDWYSYPLAKPFGKFRICYEVAEERDLYSLTNWYLERGLIFPEAFIWHVFHSIANAILQCRNGCTDNSPSTDWEEIVHVDVKGRNIFLSTPDASLHELYPSVKLGDFGSAYPIGSEAIRAFKRHGVAMGTPGFRSPEHMKGNPSTHEKGYHHLIPTGLGTSPGSYSDIWSLGMTIDCLMNLTNSVFNLECLQRLLRHGIKRPYYSKVLGGLVEQCLEPDYNRRITPYNLYQITRHYAAKHQDLADKAQQEAQEAGELSYAQKMLSTRLDRETYLKTEDAYRADKKGQDSSNNFGLAYWEKNLASLHDLLGNLKGNNNDQSMLRPNDTLVERPDGHDIDSIEQKALFPQPPTHEMIQNPSSIRSYSPYILPQEIAPAVGKAGNKELDDMRLEENTGSNELDERGQGGRAGNNENNENNPEPNAESSAPPESGLEGEVGDNEATQTEPEADQQPVISSIRSSSLSSVPPGPIERPSFDLHPRQTASDTDEDESDDESNGPDQSGLEAETRLDRTQKRKRSAESESTEEDNDSDEEEEEAEEEEENEEEEEAAQVTPRQKRLENRQKVKDERAAA